ncbi:MAG: hypothetical protein IT313_06900 [Anaerolineales bacterium]|nr:hypothetical protein [Anaerolineales bacterium]
MNLNSIWSVLEESSEILFDGYAYPAADVAAQELSLPPDHYNWVTALWLFDTQSFTVAQYMRCFPYGLAQANAERFASAVQGGYLASDGDGTYRATESGSAAATRLIQAGEEVMVALTPMPKASLRALGNLLARISDAALHLPEPPAHVLIKAKRDLYQRTGTFAMLEGFVAHCALLEGRRDDCYIATWKAHGVEGHAWETLDFLSHGDAVTFDDLHKKLSRRGVTEEVHAGDVKELVRRGWAEEGSGVYQITPKGKQVRAEVEAETERLFFAPWACLNESELEELSSLASQLRDGLRNLDNMDNPGSIK